MASIWELLIPSLPVVYVFHYALLILGYLA